MTAAEDNAIRAALPGSSLVPRRIRLAAAAPFLVLGIVFSSYFVRMRSVKLEFGLLDGQLGTLLVVPVLTGVVTMQLTGTLVARVGSPDPCAAQWWQCR